jgi:hypothetical protein
VSTAASEEPVVSATLAALLTWDPAMGAEPWRTLPLVVLAEPGAPAAGSSYEAARTSVVAVARAARALEYGEEIGPCLDLVHGLSEAAVVASGQASALPGRRSGLVEAAVCARAGLASLRPAIINPEAPPIPERPAEAAERVVDTLQAMADVARTCAVAFSAPAIEAITSGDSVDSPIGAPLPHVARMHSVGARTASDARSRSLLPRAFSRSGTADAQP